MRRRSKLCATVAFVNRGDLWGPLIFCLTMAMFIAMSSSAVDDENDVFGVVYLTLFGGAGVIGINTFLVSEVS